MPTPQLTRSRMWVGVAVVVVYLAAVAGTVAFSGNGVRPLFDGFEGGGPPRPYQWVEPPRGLGDGNITPRPNLISVDFDAGVSEPAGVTSADSQLVLNLPAGAFPAEPGATKVAVAMTPLAPGTLGAIPTYLPDGNAYRVRMTSQPGGGDIDAIAVPGNIVLIVPQLAVTILYSPDGTSWEQIPSQLLGDPVTIGGSFTRAGYYVVGTTEPPPIPEPSEGSSSKAAFLFIAAAVGLGLLLGLRARRRQLRQGPPGQWQEPVPESVKALPGSGTNRKS